MAPLVLRGAFLLPTPRQRVIDDMGGIAYEHQKMIQPEEDL